MTLPQSPNRITEQGSRHIPSLDGIRAISFFLVFLAHCGLEELVPGGFGVTVFFFLSGFLITTLLRIEYDTNHSIHLKHFWMRRALRILPPFYTVLVLSIMITTLFGSMDGLAPAGIAAQMLHFVNYWIISQGADGLSPGTGVYWSLAVEEHFYLLFPWIYIWMRRRAMSNRQQALLLWSFCLVIVVWRSVLVLKFSASPDRTYLATDTRIDSTLFGCALAVWCNPVLDANRYNENVWKFCIVPTALGVILGCLLYRDPAFRETIRYSLQGIALTPLFVAAVRFHTWLPVRFLNWKPVAFVGTLSYSLYLLHDAVIFHVSQHFLGLSPFARGLLSFAISLGIAWLMYVCIEKPCAALRRKLTYVANRRSKNTYLPHLTAPGADPD